MNLIEWTKHFVQVKYLGLKDLKEQDKTISFNLTSKKYLVEIHEEFPERVSAIKDTNQIIVTLNTKKNVKTMISNMNELAKNQNLTIVYANPTQNHKWLIKPYTHMLIADKKSLKTGIMSLFDTVEEV